MPTDQTLLHFRFELAMGFGEFKADRASPAQNPFHPT
jgi:hypothetical protein